MQIPLTRLVVPLALIVTHATVILSAQRAPHWNAVLDRTITADAAGLSRIDQLLILPSGEIAVAQSQDALIRFIGVPPANAAVAFGRNGEGPGEFRNLRWIGTQGGALWAEDPNLKRITFVDARHKLVKTIREPTVFVHGTADTLKLSIGFIQGLAPDGSFIVMAMRGVGQPPPSWASKEQWDGMPYLRVTANGRIQAVFAWVPRNPCNSNVAMPRGFAAFHIPFCAGPLSSIASDGSTIAVVQADQAAHSYQVWAMKPSGDTAFSRRFNYSPVAIPNSRFDSALTRARTSLEKLGASVPSFHRPDSYPPLDHLVVGRDGSVWLGDYLVGTTRGWHVLDRTGTLIGDVTLPGNVTVAVAERGQVWGIARDSDGNESIVHYSLAPGR